jgi:very-short-patch-repair endonuclease
MPNSLTARARQLRQADNPAEALLWSRLKAKQLGGYKFVRQFPIPPYIADFAQRSSALVIEVDGSQHIDSNYDQKRDEFMRTLGYSILRVWSGDVLRNIDGICATILSVLEHPPQAPIIAPDMKYLPGKRGLNGPLSQLR